MDAGLAHFKAASLKASKKSKRSKRSKSSRATARVAPAVEGEAYRKKSLPPSPPPSPPLLGAHERTEEVAGGEIEAAAGAEGAEASAEAEAGVAAVQPQLRRSNSLSGSASVLVRQLSRKASTGLANINGYDPQQTFAAGVSDVEAEAAVAAEAGEKLEPPAEAAHTAAQAEPPPSLRTTH